jgi:hypothetical protein
MLANFQAPGLKDWLKKNRSLILAVLVGYVSQFLIFKFLYPYPNFLPESTSYIDAAANNQSLNSWPIGYSKFLRIFHMLIRSHLALTVFQYIFLQINLIFFLFTLSYLLKLNKGTNWILFTLNSFNPILLHLTNFVSSDAIFVGLSLFWIASLFWILRVSNLYLFGLHSLALFIAFTFRYYALYYPLISIFAVIVFRKGWGFKVKYITIVSLPLLFYIKYTVNEYKRETGIAQFSSFGGWQLAANALYAYSHTSLESSRDVPSRFKALHQIVNEHMNWLNLYAVRPDSHIGIYYQWDDKAPLKVYMRYYWQNDSVTNSFKRYAIMGNLYSSYGLWIIKRHPISYLEYFVFPNLLDYYTPPTEFMGYYNMGLDSVSPTIVKWFGLNSNKVDNYYKSKTITIAEIYTILIPIINIIFVTSLLSLLSLKTTLIKETPLVKQILQIAFLVWASTLFFSAFTAYIILRYEIFSLVLTLSFAIVCISLIIQNVNVKETNEYPVKSAASY